MSDNEQENENLETVADIVADIRERAYNATRHGERTTDNYAVSELLKSIAARIEAALKRERAKVEADALEVGGIVEAARTAEKSSAVGNAAAMLGAMLAIRDINDRRPHDADGYEINDIINDALSAPPRKGKWKNGRRYEYEYAYCSECGRMQLAGWDTHKQAEENIESFACDYKYCPGCGAEMEGGVYVK